jgi:hypothetical protein
VLRGDYRPKTLGELFAGGRVGSRSSARKSQNAVDKFHRSFSEEITNFHHQSIKLPLQSYLIEFRAIFKAQIDEFSRVWRLQHLLKCRQTIETIQLLIWFDLQLIQNELKLESVLRLNDFEEEILRKTNKFVKTPSTTTRITLHLMLLHFNSVQV